MAKQQKQKKKPERITWKSHNEEYIVCVHILHLAHVDRNFFLLDFM